MDDAGHFPVLAQFVVDLLGPSAKSSIVDCTVGLGGHAEALLEAAGEAGLIGIDLDESSLLKTKERLARFGPRVRLFEANFADLRQVMSETGLDRADAILADLGVSSTQFDQAQRGFSFQSDGPLDMRMRREGPTAADLVNGLDEKELADLIYGYGEERHSRRIARAIVAARRERPIERTGQLAQIAAQAAPKAGYQRIHPATRTFQALRIAVNHELDNLQRLLAELPDLLSSGGRAAIISFHSLEDRLVKQAFAAGRAGGQYRLLTPKPLTPIDEEIQRNPRSRSAKLRAIEKT